MIAIPLVLAPIGTENLFTLLTGVLSVYCWTIR